MKQRQKQRPQLRTLSEGYASHARCTNEVVRVLAQHVRDAAKLTIIQSERAEEDPRLADIVVEAATATFDMAIATQRKVEQKKDRVLRAYERIVAQSEDKDEGKDDPLELASRGAALEAEKLYKEGDKVIRKARKALVKARRIVK